MTFIDYAGMKNPKVTYCITYYLQETGVKVMFSCLTVK